jgi:transglutaminase-like putative cysteine protease
MKKKIPIILLTGLMLISGCQADDYTEYTSIPSPVISNGTGSLQSVYLTTPPIYVSVPDVTTIPTTTVSQTEIVTTTTNILDLFRPVPIDEYYGGVTGASNTYYTNPISLYTDIDGNDFSESALPAPDPSVDGDTSIYTPTAPISSNEIYFAYDYRSLTAAQKQLYTFFVNNVNALPENLMLGDIKVTADDYQIVYNMILQYDPRFFFLGNEIRAAHYPNDTYLTAIMPSYNDEKNAIISASEKIETAAELILSETTGLGEFDKAVYFYDTLLDRCRYELEGDTARTLYGVFINGAAQCQGYAKAYKYLCNKAGLECYLVNGYTAAGEAHMWNLVRVNGNWYNVDLTKGDSNEDFAKYNYCLIDDAHIYKNYTRDHRNTALPAANSMSDNYYVRKGLYAKTADEAMLIFKRAVLSGTSVSDGCIEIMVDDETAFAEFADILTDPENADALNRVYEQVNITATNKISTDPCYFSRYDDDLVFIAFPKYE